jgi:hypothetical protein
MQILVGMLSFLGYVAVMTALYKAFPGLMMFFQRFVMGPALGGIIGLFAWTVLLLIFWGAVFNVIVFGLCILVGVILGIKIMW